MLADKEGIESRISQANQIFVPVQAGFADGDAICGNCVRQIERSFQAHLEISKIAVVYADDARTGGYRAIEFCARVNFHERLHLERTA